MAAYSYIRSSRTTAGRKGADVILHGIPPQPKDKARLLSLDGPGCLCSVLVLAQAARRVMCPALSPPTPRFMPPCAVIQASFVNLLSLYLTPHKGPTLLQWGSSGSDLPGAISLYLSVERERERHVRAAGLSRGPITACLTCRLLPSRPSGPVGVLHNLRYEARTKGPQIGIVRKWSCVVSRAEGHRARHRTRAVVDRAHRRICL